MTGTAIDPSPSPALALPIGAWDSHCHVFGPFDRYPLPGDRSFNPPLASEPMLRQLHTRLGFARAVIVQSQGHGFDHRPLLDAVRAGAGRYRGVALIRQGDPDEHLAALAAGGVCGARLNFLPHLGGPPQPEVVRTLAGRIRPFRWHLALHVAGDQIVTHAPLIHSLELPIVIDHMARIDITAGPDGPAMTALRRLIDTGRVWVKLSGADRLSCTGAPFHDVLPVARALARHAPERVLWGSDWPHVNLRGAAPDDSDLVDLIADIVPEDSARQRLLVDNPGEVFGP